MINVLDSKKKRKVMDGKLLKFSLLTIIEVILISYVICIKWIYDFHLPYLNLNVSRMLYLICFMMFGAILIHRNNGKFSFMPTFNYPSISFIFLFSSYLSHFSVVGTNSNIGFNGYLTDLLYFLSRYIFLLIHLSKYEQIHYTLRYKIHCASFGVFMLDTFIASVSNLYHINHIYTLCFVLFVKYTVDIIIVCKIVMQLRTAHHAIHYVDTKDQGLKPTSTSKTDDNNDCKCSSKDAIQTVRSRFGHGSHTTVANTNRIGINKAKVEQNEKGERKRRSSIDSLKIIDEYRGNDKIKYLRLVYQKQHKRKKRSKRSDETTKAKEIKTRAKPRLRRIVPPKPTYIDSYIDERVKQLYNDFTECFGANKSHYVGMCGDHGIEIKFVSNINGNVKGKRVINFRSMKDIEGEGKVFMDAVWNDCAEEYVGGVCFQYVDIYDGVETKLELNSVAHETDCDHLYFEGNYFVNGQCIGSFNMTCVSIRRRDISKRRQTLLEYHGENQGETEDMDMPKYLACIHDSTHTIDSLYHGHAK
eukprot:173771_1